MSWSPFMKKMSILLILFTMSSLQTILAKDIEILFAFSSEKQNWIKEMTENFNQQNFKIANGKTILVSAKPMGSVDLMKKILSGEMKAHLVSPASRAFITLYNVESNDKFGKLLVEDSKNILLSPVVVAMWKPMAEALGWGKKPIGWAEILNMADHPEGWAAYDYPQWGKFKFGHTHPEYSGSGLISLLAEAYAGSGKSTRLTLADVNNPDVRKYVETIEKSVVHYGESTGFFGEKMFVNGPEYLSAAVLYENMVIDSYDPKYHLPFPIIALYPEEGTFWSDHPTGIVEREWVTQEHREAATVYLNYLLARPQQESAVRYGFRPVLRDIPLEAPFDAAHGIDLKEPKTLLEIPDGYVIREVLSLWRERKKHSNIVLVLDISGSMRGEKINQARQGALRFLAQMGKSDIISLLPFNQKFLWTVKSLSLDDEKARQKLEQSVKTLFAAGGTALYDAIAEAHQYLTRHLQPDSIAAIVVLSDGEDTNSQLTLDQLLTKVQLTEQTAIQIFPIRYGQDANEMILEKIASATQNKLYQGDTENIEKVFLEISTFF